MNSNFKIFFSNLKSHKTTKSRKNGTGDKLIQSINPKLQFTETSIPLTMSNNAGTLFMVKSVSGIDGSVIGSKELCHKSTDCSEPTFFDVQRLMSDVIQNNQLSFNISSTPVNTESTSSLSITNGKVLDASSTSTNTNIITSKAQSKSKTRSKKKTIESEKSNNKKASTQSHVTNAFTLVASSVPIVSCTASSTEKGNQLILPPVTAIATLPMTSISPIINVKQTSKSKSAPKAKSANSGTLKRTAKQKTTKACKKKEENLMISSPAVLAILPSIASVTTTTPPTITTGILPPVASLVTPKTHISPVKRKRSFNPLRENSKTSSGLTLAALSEEPTNGMPIMFRPASPLAAYVPSPATSNISLTDGNNSLDTLDLFVGDEFGNWSVDGAVTMNSSSVVDQFGLSSYNINSNGNAYNKSSKDFYICPFTLDNNLNDGNQSTNMMSILTTPSLASDINTVLPNISQEGEMPKDLPEDIFDSDDDDNVMISNDQDPMPYKEMSDKPATLPSETITTKQSLKRSTSTTDCEFENNEQCQSNIEEKSDNDTSPTKKKRESKKKNKNVQVKSECSPKSVANFNVNDNMINVNVSAAVHALGDESLGRSTAIPIKTEICGSVVTLKLLGEDSMIPIGSISQSTNLNICQSLCTSTTAANDVFSSTISTSTTGPNEMMLNTGVTTTTMVPINNNGKKVRLAPVSALAAIANNGTSSVAAGVDMSNCISQKNMSMINSNNHNNNLNVSTSNTTVTQSIISPTRVTKPRLKVRAKKSRPLKKPDTNIASTSDEDDRPSNFGNMTYSNPKMLLNIEPPGSPNTRRAYFNDKRALIWKSMIKEIQNKMSGILKRRNEQIGMKKFLAFECQKAFETKNSCFKAKQECENDEKREKIPMKKVINRKPTIEKNETSSMSTITSIGQSCLSQSESVKTIVVHKIEPTLDQMITTLDEANMQQMQMAMNIVPCETMTIVPDVNIKTEIEDAFNDNWQQLSQSTEGYEQICRSQNEPSLLVWPPSTV